MLFFNKNVSNNFNFKQFFSTFNKFNINNNLIYNFNNDNLNFNNVESQKIKCNIYIKDNLIQYETNDVINTFYFSNQINENINFNIFWNYIKTNNEKLPPMTNNNYDFYYFNISFEFFEIENNKFFVIQKHNKCLLINSF